MKQPALDFRLPSVPFQTSSHASFTGAQVASAGAETQKDRLLKVIQARGPITQADLVRVTGYPINVVTARVRALVLEGLVRSEGFEDGPSGARRTRWRACVEVPDARTAPRAVYPTD